MMILCRGFSHETRADCGRYHPRIVHRDMLRREEVRISSKQSAANWEKAYPAANLYPQLNREA
jgi:hypothetical protein